MFLRIGNRGLMARGLLENVHYLEISTPIYSVGPEQFSPYFPAEKVTDELLQERRENSRRNHHVNHLRVASF